MSNSDRSSSSEPPQGPRNAVLRRVWARMAGIYGSRWTSGYGEACEGSGGSLTTAGDTWQRGLAGITDQQIAAGMQACLMSADPWPPTLPQFRAMCLNIPSKASVRKAVSAYLSDTAYSNEPSSELRQPFNRLVFARLDWYRYRHSPCEIADKLVSEAYEEAREHVMRGGEYLPEPIAEIGQDETPPTPADPEKVKEHMRRLEELLGLNSEESNA